MADTLAQKRALAQRPIGIILIYNIGREREGERKLERIQRSVQ